MFAYSVAAVNVLWTMIGAFCALLVLWLVVWCLIDNFRRTDHHGFAKAAWTLVVLLIPIFGALVYILARPSAVAVESLNRNF